MELQHHFSVPAPIETTWSTFMDLAGVGSCFPGATVTSVEGDSFEGTVKVKLGPIALQYAGSGRFVSRDDAAHRAVLEAKGKDKRGNGTAGATVTIALTADGDAATAVDVGTELSVTGKPAQFGRGVMQDVSDKLLLQFVGCLEQRFASDVAASGVAPEPTPAPGQAAAAEPAASPVAEPDPAASPLPTTPRAQTAPAPAEPEALDLGATVLPAVLKAYAPQLAAAAVGLVVGIVIGRSLPR